MRSATKWHIADALGKAVASAYIRDGTGPQVSLLALALEYGAELLA